jgi:hypothetical protein
VKILMILSLKLVIRKEIYKTKIIFCLSILGDLNDVSQQFHYGAQQVYKKYWWQNVKVNIDFVFFFISLIIISIIDVDYYNRYCSNYRHSDHR